jgi:hypothetical protein
MRLSIQRGDGTVNTIPSWENSAEPWPDHEGMIYAYGQVLGNEHWMHLPGLASFRFSSHGDDTAVAVTSAERDELVLEAYRRRVLPMAVQVRGREVLHASAIRGPAGVVAFCGTTQSGKSTLAFGLSQRGYTLWADDMVAFEMSDRGAVGVSLPFRPRLRKSAAELVAVNATTQTFPRHDATPPGTDNAPLAIVCILRKEAAAPSPVAVRRLSSADAFATVLDHSCCFFPQGDARKRLMIRHYLELVAVTPIYEICFQPGLTNFPIILDAVERLLDSPAQ